MFKRKIARSKSKEDPFNKFSLELADLKKRSRDLDSEQLKINLFHIIRRFYSKLLHVKYSTTFEEINHEIKNKKNIPYAIKQKMISFNERITSIEYAPEVVDKNTLLSIIDEILVILNQLHLHREANKKSSNPLPKKKKSLILLLLKAIRKRVTKLDIQKMIIKAYSYLDLNRVQDAEKLYNKIKRAYELLDENDQKEVKGDILNLFLDIKRAKQNK